MRATFSWAISIGMVLGLANLVLLRAQIKQLEGKVSDEAWKLLQVYQMDPSVSVIDLLASRELQPNWRPARHCKALPRRSPGLRGCVV